MENEEWQDWNHKERKKWQAYEAEKNKIKRLNYPARIYEAELEAVIKRLKL